MSETLVFRAGRGCEGADFDQQGPAVRGIVRTFGLRSGGVLGASRRRRVEWIKAPFTKVKNTNVRNTLMSRSNGSRTGC